MAVQRVDCGRCTWLGRVEKCNIALQYQIVLVLLGAGLLSIEVLFCDGKNAEPVAAEACVLRLQSLDQRRFHRRQLAIQFELRALLEDLLWRAFGQQDGVAVRIFHHHRHHAPSEVKGNLVQLLELLDQFLLMKVRAIQNRRVQQVLQASLEVADEIAIEQHRCSTTRSSVSVPVLSVQSTSIPPKF